MLEEEALTKQDVAREERQEELERTFSYDGYQVVRKELFAHLRDPAIVIRNDGITFNTAWEIAHSYRVPGRIVTEQNLIEFDLRQAIQLERKETNTAAAEKNAG